MIDPPPCSARRFVLFLLSFLHSSKSVPVIHQPTQDAGLAGHCHLVILMFLFHKCLLQLSTASAQAVYENLLLMFPLCRLWYASSCPKAWVSPPEKDTMSCPLVVLLTIQKHNEKKAISQAGRIKPVFSKSPWPSKPKQKYSPSIARVERERTHHRAFPLPPIQSSTEAVTSCFFRAFSMGDDITPDSYATISPGMRQRGRMTISTKFFLLFESFFFFLFSFPSWSAFIIAWIPTMSETSPTGALRATHPPAGVCQWGVHKILVQHWQCSLLHVLPSCF